MTTQSSPLCPRCQTQALVFVRDGEWTPGVDNMVCESCRGEGSRSLLTAGLVTE